MGISCIVIKKADGETTTLSAPFSLKASGSTRLQARDKTVILSRSSDPGLFEDAFNLIIASKRYISRINGVEADEDNQFWIGVDQCTSAQRGTATFTLFDLCPACGDCSATAKIRNQIERYKIIFNVFKDVSLYPAATALARKSSLLALRQDFGEECLQESADADTVQLKADQLLRNYITTVHMWNYVVSHITTKTKISTPPENEAGLVVQTAYALPVCDGSARLSCSVSIYPYSTQPQLSAYVPPPKVTFRAHSLAGHGAEELLKPVTIDQNGLPVTARTQFDTTKITVSGTFMLTVKYLPFLGAQLRDTKGNLITISTDNWFRGKDETADLIKLYTGATYTPAEYTKPSLTDYVQASCFPSKTTENVFNIWQITVAWTLNEKTEQQTFLFRTAGVRTHEPRVLMDDSISIDSSWVSRDDNVPGESQQVDPGI